MKAILRQLAKTVVVSQIAFWLDFGLLAALTEAARVHYLASAAVSFLLATTLSYYLSVRWVFEVRRFPWPRKAKGGGAREGGSPPSKALEYGSFVLVGVVGLGLNEALLWAFTDRLGLYYLVSKLVAATLVFFWNFGARKWLLFR